MDTIDTLRTFVRVVETGCLSTVAREMNASQSTVSRQITQLEDHFGVRLFHRTTRRLSLTDDGLGLRDHARSVLETVEGVELALERHTNRRRLGPRACRHAGFIERMQFDKACAAVADPLSRPHGRNGDAKTISAAT